MSEPTRQRAQLVLPADHPSFAGHFPGRPIVPGALLIDLAIIAIERASGRSVSSVAQAKFVSPAVPGEPLAVLFEVSGNAVRFDVETPEGVGSRKLVSGRLGLASASEAQQ
jgi:3-hydroxymyristoyl/3-hydroxydecanoyl-(acyl carrier protein) dehydratase